MDDTVEALLLTAKEELKRADHLIYVSLKYTRTCDIFKSIIERLMNSVDFVLAALLKTLEEEKKIHEIPHQPGIKCSVIKQNFENENITAMVDFYLLLRLMCRADFTRHCEFRRHVKMVMNIVGKDVEVTIDNITDYYKKTEDYVNFVESFLKKEKEEE